MYKDMAPAQFLPIPFKTAIGGVADLVANTVWFWQALDRLYRSRQVDGKTD
jgi:hypothetical protein